MLKSLFSGVSGLQSHQVAMDVESNNIANVNTVGYKYSRANFSDLLAQTSSIATAPQGKLGGQNPIQVGLGSNIGSMTRLFSQGSIQNTDKNTDVAIQGDGFFVVSADGGANYKYTRAGDFKFDAGGNFVDNNGYIVQGWLRNEESGIVDSSSPMANIKIAPGLTTPASATTELVLKANVNSGSTINVKNMSPAYSVASGAPADPVRPAVDELGNPIESGDLGVMFDSNGNALNLQQGQGVWMSFLSSTTTGGQVLGGSAELDITLTLDNGTTKQITTSGGLATNTPLANANRFTAAINAQTATTGVKASYNAATNQITLTNDNDSATASHNIRLTAVAGGSGLVAGDVITAYTYKYDSTGTINTADANKTFKTIADLRYAMEIQAKADSGAADSKIEIIINSAGKIQITNPGGSATGDYTVNTKVTGYSAAGVSENAYFTQSLTALNAAIPAGSGGIVLSQPFNAATHSASIDVFDSLGSKHTLKTDFRKTAVDAATGSTWTMRISVPEPATIDTIAPYNQKDGSVRFGPDGALLTYNPPNISFTAHNGSAPDQQIAIEFGNPNSFDGLTSYDGESSTSGISQDGYTGGDLVGIRIDKSGTLVGSFSNGRSFGLAQVGMAKFTNNEGLASDGGNAFIQTANSGDPIIGTAATAGRGFMQSAALEASNVDLSRALTQLIIIQRGFQANGKTITTSDQLLQTLIGLKQ